MSRLGTGRTPPPSPLTCAICNEPLESLSETERTRHYDIHFTNADNQVEPISNLNDQRPKPSSSKWTPDEKLRSSLFPIHKGAGRFWTTSHAVSTTPPNNYTPNLIPILRRALVKTHAKGTTQRAALCQEGVCHISQEVFDKTYGCGYRNFMMACTALYEQQVMPQYFTLLEEADGGPSFQSLQIWLEKAWSEGWDQLGAEQLKYKVLGTTKWIGTAELYTTFIYRGIPCRLIDFPDSAQRPEIVTKWVADYFFPPNATFNGQRDAHSVLAGASAVIQTEKLPLVLQHQGHSRTIVGIEMNRTGAPNLLVFDPARKMDVNMRKQALSSLPSVQSIASTSSKESKPSAKAILGKIFHQPDKRPRFEDSDEEDEGPAPKRSKMEGAEGKAVVRGVEQMDHLSVLKVFRVNLANLKKKDKYQILAFTLDLPLTDYEREQRKIVTSERVV